MAASGKRIGVVVAASLAVATLGAPVLGAGAGIEAPVEIALYNADDEGPARDATVPVGPRSKGVSVNQVAETLVDGDGNEVAEGFWDCTNSAEVAWFCTLIIDLEAGPYTQDGTIVIQGLFEGFNGETLAVTGGSGAYANVRGDATLAIDGDRLVRTLHLVP